MKARIKWVEGVSFVAETGTRLGLGRGSSGRSLLGDDQAQVVDAVLGEGRHAVFADAIDPQAAVFGEHVGRQVEEPILVLAEQVGDVADREDGADRRHDQAA